MKSLKKRIEEEMVIKNRRAYRVAKGVVKAVRSTHGYQFKEGADIDDVYNCLKNLIKRVPELEEVPS